jgi:hypothetical protein
MKTRCHHKRTHGVIYNRLEDGKHLSLGWCIDCGAIKRAIDGLWCGQPPKWETPAEARAQVSRGETKYAREIASTKTIQIAEQRLKIVRQINQQLKKLDALAVRDA